MERSTGGGKCVRKRREEGAKKGEDGMERIKGKRRKRIRY